MAHNAWMATKGMLKFGNNPFDETKFHGICPEVASREKKSYLLELQKVKVKIQDEYKTDFKKSKSENAGWAQNLLM